MVLQGHFSSFYLFTRLITVTVKKSYNNAQPTKAMRCFLKYLQQSQLASHEVWSSLTLLRMGLPSISWISFISSI